MYKNQLQELAQRSCFNLPCYTCIREGPDHAPRFKASVSFNGEVFESPGYHTTLRQAEHAAAEVALATLSHRGPTQSLAARILDETGVCKNLLQETAQRAGVSLPVYTTIRSGPKHLPLFKCIVEIGGRHFKGEPAKTKKQAEKNAATAAWSALNQPSTSSHLPSLLERPELAESGDAPVVSVVHHLDGRPSYQPSSSHSQLVVRSRAPITVRDRSRSFRDPSTAVAQFYPMTPVDASNVERNNRSLFNQPPVCSLIQTKHELGPRFVSSKQSLGNPPLLTAEANFESVATGQRGGPLYHPQPSASSSSRRQGRHHQRRHSLSGLESPMLSQEAGAASRASAGGNMLGRFMLHHQPQQIRGLPYQSLSERFELKRPSLLEELQQRDEEDDWLYGEQTHSLAHRPNYSSTALAHSQGNYVARMPLQSQSERFELKMQHLTQLEEVHRRDEEVWLCGDSQQGNVRHGKDEIFDLPYGHTDGWLQEGAVLSGDRESTKQREGWMRKNVLKQSSDAEREHGYTEGWFRSVGQQQVSEMERDPPLKQDHGYSYGYQEGWPSKEPVVEHDRSHSEDRMFASQSDKSVLSASSREATLSASPFSSLWSKSTQWWGSHMPSTTSSAAAAVASTLGLRPSRSAAPVVKVRQMVPVCSAPPPRRPDPSGWRHPSQSRDPVDESESCQALSNLRI